MKSAIFFRRFMLVPTVVCGTLAFVALRTDGWPRALAVGVLTGAAITGWTLIGIFGWKIKHDADQLRAENDAAVRDLHELYEARDRQAVHEEWNV